MSICKQLLIFNLLFTTEFTWVGQVHQVDLRYSELTCFLLGTVILLKQKPFITIFAYTEGPPYPRTRSSTQAWPYNSHTPCFSTASTTQTCFHLLLDLLEPQFLLVCLAFIIQKCFSRLRLCFHAWCFLSLWLSCIKKSLHPSLCLNHSENIKLECQNPIHSRGLIHIT